MKTTPLLLLFFCFSLNCHSQYYYRTRYKTAIFGEVFGLGPIASLNLEKCPYRGVRSFTAVRVGVGYVPGSKKPEGGYFDNGFSMPIAVTQNFLANNLKKRVKQRVSLKCRAAPSRVSVEWFGEFGAGYTPVLYGKSDVRHYVWGIAGLRQQIVFDIPPKPKVMYLKMYNILVKST